MAGVRRSAIWYKFLAGWRLCQTEQVLQDGDSASIGEASSKKSRLPSWFCGWKKPHCASCSACLERIICNKGNKQKSNCRERLGTSQLRIVGSPWTSKLTTTNQHWSSNCLPTSSTGWQWTSGPPRSQHQPWNGWYSNGQAYGPQKLRTGLWWNLPQWCTCMGQMCSPKDDCCHKANNRGLHCSWPPWTWNGSPWKGKGLCRAQAPEGAQSSMKERWRAIHEKEEVHWTAGNVQVMVSWFKRPGDSKMPSTKELLKEWYEQTKSRHEDDRAYLKPGRAAIIDAVNE